MEQALLLSLDDGAQAVGVSKRTLYREIKQGRLKVAKIGARTLVARSELERYCDSLSNETIGATAVR